MTDVQDTKAAAALLTHPTGRLNVLAARENAGSLAHNDWKFGRPKDRKDAQSPAKSPAKGAQNDAELLRQRVTDHAAKLRRAVESGSGKPAAAAPPADTPARVGPPVLPRVGPPVLPRSDPAPTRRMPPRRSPAPRAPEPRPEAKAASPEADDDSEEGGSLRRAINDKASRMTVDDLAKKGVRKVNVLDWATIEKIVAEAVETTLERTNRHLSAAERRLVEQEAKREFFELLDQHKRALAAKSDEERRSQALEKTVEKLRTEVARQEESLAHERTQTGVTISPKSLEDLEGQTRKILGAFMNDERRALLGHEDPEQARRAQGGLNKLEKKLERAFDRLVGRVKSDHEELLERRIEKLNKALKETEEALRRVAQMKQVDGGIASIYDSIQGLADDALNFGKKKELLAVVFLENLEIQKKEITDEDRALAAKSSPPATRTGTVDSLPPGFEPPLDPMTTETAF